MLDYVFQKFFNHLFLSGNLFPYTYMYLFDTLSGFDITSS